MGYDAIFFIVGFYRTSPLYPRQCDVILHSLVDMRMQIKMQVRSSNQTWQAGKDIGSTG